MVATKTGLGLLGIASGDQFRKVRQIHVWCLVTNKLSTHINLTWSLLLCYDDVVGYPICEMSSLFKLFSSTVIILNITKNKNQDWRSKHQCINMFCVTDQKTRLKTLQRRNDKRANNSKVASDPWKTHTNFQRTSRSLGCQPTWTHIQTQ